MFTYNHWHPRMWHDGKPIMGAPLYSGHAEGLNNPALENVHDIGPIPAGKWRIARWDDHHGDKGPVVAVLEAVGHDAYGRSGFLIHGDNSQGNFSASHGCIITGLAIRTTMRDTGDTDLLVTNGIEPGVIA